MRTIETELVASPDVQDQRPSATAVFSCIEGFYNPLRRHSSLGY